MTFRKRSTHQAKNLEKAEQAFLEKADDPVERPDVVPQEQPTAPTKQPKYGFKCFNLRLDEEQLDRLRRAAVKHDRSMHWYAVKKLMEAVDEDLA